MRRHDETTPGGVPGGSEGVPRVGGVVHALLVRRYHVGQQDRRPPRLRADVHAVGAHHLHQLRHEVLRPLGIGIS